jgi:uncharacterized protein (TIGR03083 family)
VISGAGVLMAARYVVDVLTPAVDGQWDKPAGQVDWSCRQTIAHVGTCLTWYAALLARRADTDVACGEVNPEYTAELLDSVLSGAALLALAVDAAGDGHLAWHSWGTADRSGFAGMGIDEMLVHGSDVAAGLGVAYRPPAQLCEAVLRRMFPWETAEPDPWTALLRANGRGGPADPDWRWYAAPLDTWDGVTIPRRPRLLRTSYTDRTGCNNCPHSWTKPRHFPRPGARSTQCFVSEPPPWRLPPWLASA